MKNLITRWRSYRARSQENRLDSYENLIRKVNVHKQERRAAIDFFCHHPDTPRALGALLKRFNFSDDNSIVDGKEKEAALKGIISRGEKAIPIIQKHLLKSEHIAWPLKALLALSDEATVVKTLSDGLDYGKVDFEPHKVEKNYDILCHLRDYSAPVDLAKMAHFLSATDERVRYAAVELITEKGSAEFLPQLEPFIYDTADENRRLRSTVVNAYIEHQWKLKDKAQYSQLNLPGYHINSKGAITRKSSAS